ncbi:hypothetical protein CEXT_35711 [Caerostris extrusa]|uniref:Uncharacterized protein n=1 Tax=Caerostris extrusa TaxID=172846 RepID=A0AAV4NZI5_CAEEX|nr:hypothetical protein CEXT_35711 [Caerostris extrusa]
MRGIHPNTIRELFFFSRVIFPASNYLEKSNKENPNQKADQKRRGKFHPRESFSHSSSSSSRLQLRKKKFIKRRKNANSGIKIHAALCRGCKIVEWKKE